MSTTSSASLRDGMEEVARVDIPTVEELVCSCIQSYLYHRKIYSKSVFERRYVCGIQAFQSREEALTNYIRSHMLLRDLDGKGDGAFVDRFVVNVEEPKLGETVERLTFAFSPRDPDGTLDDQYIVQTIQTLLVQVSNIPSRLGELPEGCRFSLQSYPRQSSSPRETPFGEPLYVPERWMACGSRLGNRLLQIWPLEVIQLNKEGVRVEVMVETNAGGD